MNKIEQLIKKLTDRWYKHPAQKSIPISSVKKMIASLKDTTEEKPTVATVLAYEQWYKEALSKVASILKKEKCVWVPYRNWIERWIEVAEELLANSV